MAKRIGTQGMPGDGTTAQPGFGAAAAGGPVTVGRILRARREELGQDLRYASEMLRIRYPYLEAIEEGRIDDLPGPTYAVGFVRAYAEHLGLDGNEIVARFKEEADGLDTRTKLVFPSPLPEGKIPSGAILLLAVILAVIVYGGWMQFSSNGRSLADAIPGVPGKIAALIGLGEKEEKAGSQGDVPGKGVSAENGPEKGETQTTATSEKMETAPETDASATGPASDARETAKASGPPETPRTSAVREASPDPSSGSSPRAGEAAPERDPVSTESREAPAAAAMAAAGSEPPSLAVAPEAGREKPARASTAAAPAATPESVDPAARSSMSEGPSPSSSGREAQRDGTGPHDETASANGQPAPSVIAAPPDPPVPGSDRKPRVFGAENRDARIVIRAVNDSWVEVRDQSGELLLTRVLRVGDAYRVPNRPGLSLVTGNAGGLEFTVDGEVVPPLGPVGSVRRNVALDPALLKGAGAAAR